MEKSKLIENILIMAWHSFLVSERESASAEAREECIQLAKSTKKLMEDFFEHGEFTKEEY